MALMAKKPMSQLTGAQRRVLDLLASTQEGITEGAMLLVHGFDPSVIDGLIRANLMIGKPERIRAGGKQVDVMRFWITDAGRQALN